MKVLQVHGRYRSTAPSGENLVVEREGDALRDMGHEVRLFTRDSDEIADWPLARKVMLPGRVLWSVESRRALSRALAENRPDVVHVHNTFPLLSPSVLYACRAARVPVVVTIHNYKLLCASGDFFRQGSPCHACREGQLLPALRHGCYRGSKVATVPVVASLAMHRPAWRYQVSAYIFISAAQRERMVHLGLPDHRVFVKHNLVPLARHPWPQDVRRGHRVAFLGRLDEAKGIRFLMSAWESYRAAAPESRIELAIAGGGPLESEVRRWAASRPEVEIAGLLPANRAVAFLRSALAVVVPSVWQETFGLVAVEAMAAGAAPVAPAHGSFPELITHGRTGVLYRPGDVGSLVEVLRRLDREPDWFREVGSRGQDEVLRYGPDRNIKQLLSVYRFAIANPVSGAVHAG